MVSRARWSALAMLLCAVCVVLSLGVGRVWLDPATLVAGIFEPKPNLAWLILTELRLPRTVLGLLDSSSDLRVVPLIDPDVVHPVGLLYEPRKPLSPLIQALAEAAKRASFSEAV